MKKKECPSCAMEIDADAIVCPVCSYEFPETGKPVKIIAIALAILLILMWIIF